MKRHYSKLLLIVLAIVLCFSTVLFAACNDPGDDNNTTTEQTVTTGKMLNEIVSKISSSVNFGESFGADISAAFVIDDKTTANKDVSYKLTAKGNANGKQNAAETDTDFVIEIVKEEGQNTEILLGLAYEAIDDEPFFFVNLLGGGYKKINGYSLAALYKMTQNSATTAADGGFDISTVINALIPILFGESGKVDKNVYTLNFNLAKTVSEIIKQKDLILLALGMSEDDINGLIAEYLGGLSYEQNGETVNVSDLATLEMFFVRGMSFKGQLVFTFDANDKFVNANASFDHKYQGEDQANYTLKVDKVQIGAVQTAVNSFENFALSKDERKSAQAFNLLNFSLNGTAVGYNKGKVAHNYEIEIQSDIDAFQLLNLLDGTDKANILATLKKLGYFHLEINEVFADEEPLNIIALHSKFEEGFAVVNVHAYRAVMYNLGLGGVYDFDALIDVIGMLAGNGETAAEEGGMDIGAIIDMVKNVIGYFTFDDMQNQGVTVALKDLVFMICGMAGIDTSSIVTSLGLTAIVGSETMNIKLETPTFGTCTQVETDTVKCGVRETESLYEVNQEKGYDLTASRNSFIKQIKSLDGFTGKVLQGDNTFAQDIDQYIAFNKALLMTGIDLAGNEIQTSGFIMGAKNFDPNRVGKQNVTLYIAIANDMLDFARAGFAFDDIIPLSGTLKFDTTIEVIAFDKDANVTLTNVKSDEQTVLTGSKAFDVVRIDTDELTEINVGNLGRFIAKETMVKVFDAENGGNDVTASALDSSGNFAQAGEYYVRIVFAGYSANCCKVNVEDAYAVRVDGAAEAESLVIGGTWTFSEYNVYTVDKAGKATKSDQVPTYKIGTTTLTSLSDAFDINGNVYTLKKNIAYAGKNFTISFGNVATASGLTKKIEIVIPIEADCSVNAATNYFGNSLNNGFVITISDKQYNVVYRNSAWVAVAEDGSEKPVELEMTWDKSNNTVEVNANGFIVNYPNENKASYRYTKINYTLTVDGYFYSGSFTAYELYAINKSVKVNGNLNGLITYVDKMAYQDGEGNVATLEFKYGAEGYAIYVKGTDTKVYNVTVTVTSNDEPYTLTDGTFTEVGTYKVAYSMIINGVEQTFFHTVTVKA